jgi:tetratricopeptide (TPR) repeat protein
MIISIFIGLGTTLLMEIAEDLAQSESLKKITTLLIGIVLLIGNFNLLASYYYQENKSGYYFAYDYAMNVLNTLKPNAIIFLYDDNEVLSLEYMQIVERKRRDVAIISGNMLPLPWYARQTETKGIYFKKYKDPKETIRQIVNTNLQKRPIYFTYYIPSLSKDYNFEPLGPIFEIVPKNNLTYSLKEIPYRFRKSSNTVYKDGDALWAMSKPYFNIAALLIDSKKYTEAIPYLKKGLKVNPKSSEGNFLLGFVHINLNKNKEAVYDFKIVIETTTYHEEAYKYLGLAYLNIGLHEKAFDNLNKALLINPRSSFVYYYMGLLFSIGQQPEDAILKYRTALKYNSKNTDARYALAVTLEKNKKYKEALKEWEIMLKNNPEGKIAENSRKHIEDIRSKRLN